MDVVEVLRAAAREVFTDTPVQFAYLFGSHARRQARADSDVDVDVRVADDVPADWPWTARSTPRHWTIWTTSTATAVRWP